MLWVWLLLLLALFGALVALLSIPLEVAFEAERREGTRGVVAVRWLFLRTQVRFPSERPRSERARERQRRRRERQATKPKRARARAIAVMRTRGLLPRALAFVADLVRATHPHDVDIHVQIGTGDPADTGRLWGFMGPVAALLSTLRRARLRLEPNFLGEGVIAEGRGGLLVIPLQLILIVLRFAFSPVALRAVLRGVRA